MIKLCEKILGVIAEVLASVAAITALLIALIGTIDVLTTRVLAQAVPGAFELSEAGLVLMVFLGLAIVTMEESHIKVDIVTSKMSPKMQSICAVLALTLTTIFLALMTWKMGSLASKSWQVKEVATGLLPFPIYPVKIAALAGLATASGCAFLRLVKVVVDEHISSLKGKP